MMSTVADDKEKKTVLLLFAWALILVVSHLPEIITSELLFGIPDWLDWAKFGAVAFILVLCGLWKTVRPLWQLAVVFLVFQFVLMISSWVETRPGWLNFFHGSDPTFTRVFGESFVRDIFVTLAVIATLWTLKGSRRKFFLVKGEMDAPIEPIPWLGIGKGESWRTFGWIFAGVGGLGVAISVLLSVELSWDVLRGVLPMLPSVLLFSAINSFNEEIYYRTTLLSTLPEHIGKNHALLINAVFFGMAHYLHGTPSGIFGFLLIGFYGWLIGKSLLETKGFLWAWIIHFVPDVFTFASYTLFWVQQ